MTSPLDLSAFQYVHDSAPIYCTVDFFICTLSPLSTLFDGPEYLLHHPPLKDVELALIGLPCCTGVVTAPSAPPPPVGQPPTPSRHVVSCYNTPMAMLASTHNHEQEVNSISEKKNALREKLEQLEERAAIKSREMMELKQTVLKLQQQQDWQLTNVPPPATPKVDPSLEGIKAAMDNILVKCRTKDQMITAMADELQRQRRSSAMERVLIDVATDKANMVPDFDRALLHEYLQCVYVNGNIQERVRSATRNRTLLHGLDLTRKMDILVYAVTPKGKFADPAFVSYQDTVDRPRGPIFPAYLFHVGLKVPLFVTPRYLVLFNLMNLKAWIPGSLRGSSTLGFSSTVVKRLSAKTTSPIVLGINSVFSNPGSNPHPKNKSLISEPHGPMPMIQRYQHGGIPHKVVRTSELCSRVRNEEYEPRVRWTAQNYGGHDTGCEAVVIGIPTKISVKAIPRDWTIVFDLSKNSQTGKE
uniref:Uncharacterized protein n=1 Tax=Timema bartmani TaxID=61472 RepID=A0A7R9EQT1_9NEOP|nr:unnamed protein product [Timema bartmani]